MLTTESSCNQENFSETQSPMIDRHLWLLGSFFVTFGFVAVVVLASEVFAETSGGQTLDTYSLAASMETEFVVPKWEETEFWKDYKVAQGQNLSGIFKSMKVSSRVLRDMLHADPLGRRIQKLKPGQVIRFRYEDSEFTGLEYVASPTYSILVERDGNEFVYTENRLTYDRETRHASATIKSSLFIAAQKAGISDRTTMNLAKIFGWDIDFALDIRKGDSFSVVYETLNFEGERVKDGAILAAEFVNQGKVFRAVRYTDPDGQTGYYNPQGENMYKPFLRTPVDFTRISSHFGARRHPVLNKMRKHNGVDYAAPRGTVVKASGSGKIIFQGSLRGYGNTVIIEHGAGYRTLYAHLSRYNRKQRMGYSVNQGQVIGYVGSSGMATGPHLHYEFQVNGVHKNPLTIKLPTSKSVAEKHMADFRSKTQVRLAMLNRTDNTMMLALNDEMKGK